MNAFIWCFWEEFETLSTFIDFQRRKRQYTQKFLKTRPLASLQRMQSWRALFRFGVFGAFLVEGAEICLGMVIWWWVSSIIMIHSLYAFAYNGSSKGHISRAKFGMIFFFFNIRYSPRSILFVFKSSSLSKLTPSFSSIRQLHHIKFWGNALAWNRKATWGNFEPLTFHVTLRLRPLPLHCNSPNSPNKLQSININRFSKYCQQNYPYSGNY